MYEQFYYYMIYWLRFIPGYLLRAWYWWVIKVSSFPEISITVVLVGILILIISHVKRNMKVMVIEGDEIHNLVRAIRRK